MPIGLRAGITRKMENEWAPFKTMVIFFNRISFPAEAIWSQRLPKSRYLRRCMFFCFVYISMVVIVTSVPGRSFDIIDLKKEINILEKKNIKPFCKASFWIDGLPSSQTIFENRCGWRKYRMRHSSRSSIQGFLEKLHLFQRRSELMLHIF